MKVRVQAPSRLHFGLLALGPEAPRQFGGVGVMVQEPAVEVVAEAADRLVVTGPLAERAKEVAERAIRAAQADGLKPASQGAAIEICRTPAEHVGLGAGTQLALAVARAISVLAGAAEAPATELAGWVGRGRRSAVGTHGFAQGGLVVEGGKCDREAVSPLVARGALPRTWRFVLRIPRESRGLWGQAEQEAFQRLHAIAPEVTATLCRQVLLELLPGAVEGDFARFSEAVYQFNRRVGECFASCQGGVYATPGLADAVAFLRRQGVRGVGQSSWGPTLFALAEDAERAGDICATLRELEGAEAADVLVTAVANEGAKVTVVE